MWRSLRSERSGGLIVYGENGSKRVNLASVPGTTALSLNYADGINGAGLAIFDAQAVLDQEEGLPDAFPGLALNARNGETSAILHLKPEYDGQPELQFYRDATPQLTMGGMPGRHGFFVDDADGNLLCALQAVPGKGGLALFDSEQELLFEKP